MTAPPGNTTTDFHAVIEALRAERDAALSEKATLAEELAARDAALAQRNSEYGERIELQAATVDVLKVMSASPGDAQSVFRLIVERARAFCEADGATLALLNHDMLHLQAFTGLFDITYEAQFPRPVSRATIFGRAILARNVVQVADVSGDADYYTRARGLRAIIAVPLVRAGVPIGAISIGRGTPGEFSAAEVELLQTFAEQAVIAITSAETYRALQTRTSDLQETLEYQTATSDVLKVISRSTFDLQPVLDSVVETAARLCNADRAAIFRREGDLWRLAVNFGFPPAWEDYIETQGPFTLDRFAEHAAVRAVVERRAVHIDDLAAIPGYENRLGEQRTTLGVPLLREGEAIGTIVLARLRVEPFTDRQIELVSTFADQAVIAIENTRLITEQREALERQTATAEVLGVINANPGNLGPVFDVILEKALSLAEAAFGSLWIYHGDTMHAAATRGMTPALAEFRARNPVLAVPPVAREASETRRAVQMLDIRESESYRAGRRASRAIADLGGARTNLVVPLLKDNESVGCIQIYRQEVRVFTQQQISLLEGFAAQGVIAMENARLLGEIRQRQEELRVTFENMGDGVAMFDDKPRLVAWNRKFQDILDLPDGVLAERLTFAEYIRYLAERGEYGEVDPEEQIRRLTENADQYRAFERRRPDGRVIEVRHNPVPGGGFVLIYADITERKRSEAELRAARDAAEEASRTIEAAYRDLKAAQANLIQAEKMASLGQLTAGIAHEIKNPLNFVNNFAALSVDLLSELKETAAPGFAVLPEKQRTEVEDVSAMLTSNLEKIAEHGKRADDIVKAMLEHSRGSSGERRMVDLNTLIDDALSLAYHGARAQDRTFSIALERDYAQGMAPIELAPQDMIRVFLNLFSNGFYAATRRAREGGGAEYVPTLKVTTRDLDDAVEVRVRDNGTGIPADIRDKLFQPFFTTKPTGEGTGLGLSLSYDIVVKQHAGQLSLDSRVGEFSEFVVTLPRSRTTSGGTRS